MLRPVLRPSRAPHLASPKPGRIERRSDWTQLTDSADPLGHCGLEILTCTKNPKPAGLVHDHGHAWIRLWRNGQDYVSLGFYPDESTRLDPEDRPGLRMPGMILTPDKYDKVDWPRRATKHPITQAQYRDLVSWIETRQANRMQGALAFDLVDRNCVGFVVEAAARCGIAVEADQSLLGFLPLKALGWLDRPTRPLRALVYRLGIALFGGLATMPRQYVTVQGAPSLETVQGIDPIFARPSDLFKRVPFYHVRALQTWQDQILKTHDQTEPPLALQEAPS